MVRKIPLLGFSSVLLIGAGNKPPNVPTFVAQPVTYAAGTTSNVLASTDSVAYATAPANIPAPPATFAAPYYTSNGSWNATTCNYQTNPDCENKLRFNAGMVGVLPDDSVRAYGEPGKSHLHEWFGNFSWNANSYYQTLRTRCHSTLHGDCINASAYWIPAPIIPNALGDGIARAWRADHVNLYYVREGTGGPTARTRFFPTNFSQVGGQNVDDPLELGVKAEIASANAQPGTAFRYTLANGYNPTGSQQVSRHSWNCAGQVKNELKNADGSDPWAGACDASQAIVLLINTPQCWDNVNPWGGAPNVGYSHMRYAIYDGVKGMYVCPNNWAKVFTIGFQFAFDHRGFSDYGRVRLSSDDAYGTAGGFAALNGSSAHVDYQFAWDNTILQIAQKWGAGGVGSTTGDHLGNDGIISDTEKLSSDHFRIGAFPPSSAANMFIAPTVHTGSKTFTGHS